MIYELAHWDRAYRRLIQHIRTNNNNTSSEEHEHEHEQEHEQEMDNGTTGSSVLILCAMDADALCAARILSYLLRADNVPYQLRPCPSHSSLVHILSNHHTHEIGCIVLLNIGGMSNLTKFYASGEGENDNDNDNDDDDDDQDTDPILPMSTLTFVMDCHRPWHLANIHAGDNIILFKEESLEEDVPSDGDGLSGNESESDSDSDDDDDDDDDDSENDNDDDDEGEAEFDEEAAFEDAENPPQKKRKTNVDHSDASDTEASEQEDNDDNNDDDDQESKIQNENEDDEHSQSNPQDDLSNPQDIDDDDNNNTDDENASHATPTSSIISEQDKSQSQSQSQSSQNPPTNTKLTFKQKQKDRRDRISTYYYSGSYHRAPVSWIAYTLSRQLRFGDLGDLLWLACVGVTDAFLHSRLDTIGYTEFVYDLRRHIQRLYPDDEVTRAMKAIHAADGTPIGVSEHGRILCQTEFRFMLLRHWSLLDAMMHSNFVGTKLQVWKEQGRFKLTELLAKMGFPLHECKQPWAFMKPSLKKHLREAVMEHKEEYDLDEINYTGFIRVTGYKSLISASDMSYSITALLESETPATLALSNHNTDDDNNNNNNPNPMIPSHDDPAIMQSFNIAYDALNAKSIGTSTTTMKSEGSSLSNLVNGGDLSGSEGLGAGIRLAMQLQKSIISTAVGLVDKNAITRLKHFRYAYLYATGSGSADNTSMSITTTTTNTNLNSNAVKEHHIFSRPLALCKLAHFLMDMHRDKWVNRNARPLVLIAEKPKTKTFLIVGYHFADNEGDTTKNKFRKYFELTAKSMEGLCEVRLESFEGNVVEVAAGGEQRFVEQLHYLMDVVQKME